MYIYIKRKPAIVSTQENQGFKILAFESFSELDLKFDVLIKQEFFDPLFNWGEWQLENTLTRELVSDVEGVKDELRFDPRGDRSSRYYLVKALSHSNEKETTSPFSMFTDNNGTTAIVKERPNVEDIEETLGESIRSDYQCFEEEESDGEEVDNIEEERGGDTNLENIGTDEKEEDSNDINLGDNQEEPDDGNSSITTHSSPLGSDENMEPAAVDLEPLALDQTLTVPSAEIRANVFHVLVNSIQHQFDTRPKILTLKNFANRFACPFAKADPESHISCLAINNASLLGIK
ncbi:hypothetical protein ABW20_dc0106459 [Dactylellina cionopaga]|nr:hypothetical protein ABW20_dc0106459 [Dactylellina cionopaga]